MSLKGSEMKKVLYYTNQFFGQIGGEDQAYSEPQTIVGAHGAANAIKGSLDDTIDIVATIICGDNYFSENIEKGKEYIQKEIKKYNPDILIAGPAFNAGRFGIACGEACKAANELGLVAITALYEENPAVEMYKRYGYILKSGKSAASMRKDAKKVALLATKILNGQSIGSPEEEEYYPKGQRINFFEKEKGSDRAVEMLIKKLHNESYKTELEISRYEKVEASPPIHDLSNAKIALCTTGGIVIHGNPDKMVAATAKFWKKYPIGNKDSLIQGEWESVHAGYDPVYANEDPNRVAPYNALKALEKDAFIGSVHPFLYTTTGNSTSVADATRMGEEIAKDLLENNVDGVILTST